MTLSVSVSIFSKFSVAFKFYLGELSIFLYDFNFEVML